MNVKNYLKRRNESNKFNKLIEFAYLKEKEIDDMINARILKPSNLKIDETIESAKEIREFIFSLPSDKSYRELLENSYNKIMLEEKFKNIEELNIEKLHQCKAIYGYCIEIGRLGIESNGLLYNPICWILTIPEVLIITLLIITIIKVIY